MLHCHSKLAFVSLGDRTGQLAQHPFGKLAVRHRKNNSVASSWLRTSVIFCFGSDIQSIAGTTVPLPPIAFFHENARKSSW